VSRRRVAAAELSFPVEHGGSHVPIPAGRGSLTTTYGGRTLKTMHREAVLPRVTTWLVLIAYVLVVSGLPLPLGVAGPDARTDVAAEKRLAVKDRSRPFPCMDKPCGCATAEQCFSRCCCNTPAETLAWARAHRVDVAVLESLERRVQDATGAQAGSCCAVKAQRSRPSTCCATASRENNRQDRLCSEAHSLTRAPAAAERPPMEQTTPRGSRTVVLRAMLACGGIVAQWCAATMSLPPPTITFVFTTPLVERLKVVNDTCRGVVSAPESPPPRCLPA